MMTGEIQIGDLVLYRPEPITHGTLPYFKHITRRRQLLGNKAGLVIDQHAGMMLVLFASDPIACKKEDLDLASPNN